MASAPIIAWYVVTLVYTAAIVLKVTFINVYKIRHVSKKTSVPLDHKVKSYVHSCVFN